MYENNTGGVQIIDAYENNLKHISITIPKRKLVVFTGLPGSNKSSLVFNTIANENARQ